VLGWFTHCYLSGDGLGLSCFIKRSFKLRGGTAPRTRDSNGATALENG
jgi:hypothetical protein